MCGIEKEIDGLGRVVIPMKFRKKLGAVSNSKVLISMAGDNVLISPITRHCALCGKEITQVSKIRLCASCISEVKTTL